MGVLKKIKGSTLVETIVATVLILIIFMISSLIINSIFRNNLTNNTAGIETHLTLLEYKLQLGQVTLPYFENYADWEVSIEKSSRTADDMLLMRAQKANSDKEIEKYILNEN
ncbi:hypothetical protein DSM03_11720 [Leeuwenhoekiella aestuarii]|uniref:hypothetical protein n=1 Tax=Leeuwenhoekiella aestuarii TaxID=2249426 RepID=UPI000FFEDFE3|nr:hypothetical protein [Leeuwenhoekiella aestuarii]RXG11383.1 hypothetical protein DSM03_11720 [Leeuwenhoekiella aestuarii]